MFAYMAMTFAYIYPYTMHAYIHICIGPACFLFARNKRNVLIDETLTWKFRVDAVFGDGDGVVVQLVL